jgi:hypothetical protein
VKRKPTPSQQQLILKHIRSAGGLTEFMEWVQFTMEAHPGALEIRRGHFQGTWKKHRVDWAVLDIAQNNNPFNMTRRDRLKQLIPMFYRITPHETEEQILDRLEGMARADRKGVRGSRQTASRPRERRHCQPVDGDSTKSGHGHCCPRPPRFDQRVSG